LTLFTHCSGENSDTCIRFLDLSFLIKNDILVILRRFLFIFALALSMVKAIMHYFKCLYTTMYDVSAM